MKRLHSNGNTIGFHPDSKVGSTNLIHVNQERIKGTEKASSVYTLFKR